MINQIICKFRGHRWGDWYYLGKSTTTQGRICLRCDLTEFKGFNHLKERVNGEEKWIDGFNESYKSKLRFR